MKVKDVALILNDMTMQERECNFVVYKKVPKVTLAFLAEQLVKINQRLDKIEERLDKIENRLDNLVKKNNLVE